MVQKSLSGLVELRDLTDSRELHDLRVLTMANPKSPVRELALITDIEEMTAVGPDTVALLTHDVARGGWMISAALRYAWERRACAIIVPEQSFTETVIELARRLGVSLFTTSREMRTLAIDAAIQIGVARAGSLARVQQFTQQVSQAVEASAALQLTSDELDGARVAIETAGAVTLASHHGASSEHAAPTRDDERIRVAVPIISVDSEFDALVAHVAPESASLAHQILSAATPSIRALLADARLQATRDSLPVVTIAALSGHTQGRGVDDPSPQVHIDEFSWPVRNTYFAIFIMSDAPEQSGTAVHQLWNAVLPTVPLARLVDGWIGFAPMSSDRSELLQHMREYSDRLRSLGIKIGASNPQDAPEDALRSVREAWLAARTADPLDQNGPVLVEFEQITSRLLPRLLPPELAQQIASLLLPGLLNDSAAADVISAVVAYLSHRGSISGAAEHLGVHRNTLQARLRRAEELGVRLSEPAEVLPMHMLLSGLLHVR